MQNSLVLGDVDQYPTIDVTLDGADEVDNNLNAVKGGGACHLREKVLAEAAKMCARCIESHLTLILSIAASLSSLMNARIANC